MKMPQEDLDTVPLDAMVDGTPFSVLFSRAVKLKSAQEADLRSKFESFPSFYQNSIFPREEVSKAREQDFEDRYKDGVRFKNLGNEKFKDLKYGDAIASYEMALAVFRYLVNTNPSWKNEGIKDDFIREERFETSSESEKCQVHEFLVVCYTNIALVCLKARNFNLAIEACNYAIEVEPLSVKALYLRSKARLTSKSAGDLEESLARQDLQAAKKIDPLNQIVIKDLEQLRRIRAIQRAHDKAAFNNVFQKGDWFSEEDANREGTRAKNAALKAETLFYKSDIPVKDKSKSRQDLDVLIQALMQTLKTNKNMGATWKRYFVSITRAVLVAVFVKRFMVIYHESFNSRDRFEENIW